MLRKETHENTARKLQLLKERTLEYCQHVNVEQETPAEYVRVMDELKALARDASEVRKGILNDFLADNQGEINDAIAKKGSYGVIKANIEGLEVKLTAPKPKPKFSSDDLLSWYQSKVDQGLIDQETAPIKVSASLSDTALKNMDKKLVDELEELGIMSHTHLPITI